MNPAILGGLAAAAPGVAQGVGTMVDNHKQQQALDTSMGAANTQIANDPQMQQLQQSPDMQNLFADASHPAWGILGNMTGGAGGTGGPAAPAQSPVQTLARGGVVGYEDGGAVDGLTGTPIHKFSAAELAGTAVKELGHALTGGGAADRAATQVSDRPAQVNKSVDGYQNGGVVRLNHGSPVTAPAFQRGPALLTGPNNTITGSPSPTMGQLTQGITPASTDGQILTMDAGGVVPEGFIPQSGNISAPMTGRGAGLVQGFEAGQTIGHNIAQAWHEHNAREAAGNYAAGVAGTDVDNPNPDQNHPDSILGRAKGAVEGFFQHLHDGTLNDQHKPNSDQAAPGVAAPAVPTGGAPSAAAPGAAAPSPVAPGPAPAGATPAPAPGAAPAGAQPAPSGGPAQPAQPGQAQPQPLTPQAQATADVVHAAATDPNVQAGVPDKSPAQDNKPHSLTPEYWQQMAQLKAKAVKAAALAGEDPAKVYESLSAMQTAHFQGQVLKQAATASRAFDNGDMNAVTQALKNINYYLPNGQDIDVRKATAADAAADPSLKVGDLVHSNPYAGMYGHEHEPTVVKVDQNYIQSLGQGALDPAKMHEAQMGVYSAQMEAKAKNLTAEGAYRTGQGRLLWGDAQDTKAKIEVSNLALDRALKGSQINLNNANAGKADRSPIDRSNNGQPKQTAASIRARQNDVSSYVDNTVLGRRTAEPTTINGPDGKPHINISTAAGHNVNRPELVPKTFQGFSDDQLAQVKQFGGKFAAANPEMPKEEAAELAARIVRMQSSKNPADHQHVGPDGKMHANFISDDPNQPGVAHVWVGNQYRSFYTAPSVADDASGASPVETGGTASPVGNAGGSGSGDNGPMDND